MAMTLGGVSFADWVPDDYTLPQPVRSTAAVDTYGGSAFFSWGIISVGQKVTISWDAMTKALYDQLMALLVADAAVTWLPEDSYSYTVQITDLNGTLVTTFANAYRQKVTLTMIIMAKAVA